MHILLVSATKKEIAPLIQQMRLEQQLINSRLYRYSYLNHSVDLLITGVGMMATSFWLGKIVSNGNYDFAINCGVAGSFSHELMLGEVVNVTEDYLLECGAESSSGFITLPALNLLDESDFPHTALGIKSTYSFENPVLTSLKKVNGITVNTVHGTESSIEKDKLHYRSVHGKEVITESMEGAAFLYACIHEKIPCVQLRGISNYVEERNTDKWELTKAIDSVTAKVAELMNSYADEN
ncbi:MAG: futalosine hydrolase [Bacteroidia bacterium]|nr:futalosine hydrolase [Bacteroidia bacterium]